MWSKNLKIEDGLLHGADDRGHGVGQDDGRGTVQPVDPVNENTTTLRVTKMESWN